MLTTFIAHRNSIALVANYCVISGISCECRPMGTNQAELAVQQEDASRVNRAFSLFDQITGVGQREETIGHPVQRILVRSTHDNQYLLEFQSGINLLMTVIVPTARNAIQMAKYLRTPIQLYHSLTMHQLTEIRSWATECGVGIWEEAK